MYIQSKDIVIQWSQDKNQFLKNTRGISFEEIEQAIRNGQIINSINHPNQQKYPNQKQLHLRINDYIYVVPYVQTQLPNTVFLKTAYASRKMTKLYRLKEI